MCLSTFIEVYQRLLAIISDYLRFLSLGGTTVQSKSAKNTSPPMHCCHSHAISILAVLVSMMRKVAATKRRPYFLINSLVDLYGPRPADISGLQLSVGPPSSE